jgi:carbohydrate-selective porin OprB
MKSIVRQSWALIGAAILIAGGAVSATAAESDGGESAVGQLSDIETQNESERQAILE